MSPKTPRRMLAWSLLRAALTTTALFALYYLLPLNERSGAALVFSLVVGIAVIVGVLVLNLLAIVRSDYPRLRALDALAVVLPLLIVIFAGTYIQMAGAHPSSFSAPLSRTDSLYFTVTTLCTVGFGDITPTSTATRIVTTVQMLGDLVIFGIFAKLFAGVIADGVRRRTAASPERP